MHLAVNMENSGQDLEGIQKKRRSRWYYPSHGDELELELEGDKVTKTLPEENRRRRTIILYKVNNSWGFTIQSYGIHHKKENEIEMLTYVDYIAPGGAAHLAGMRPGDVILSINGTSMESADHKELVRFIQSVGDTMRIVVLFEDCCKKVELHMRYLKLQRVLMEKIFELRSLESQEKRVLKGMSRFDSRLSSRSSSSTSLNSALDDRLSLRPELDRCPSPIGLAPGPGRSPTASPRGSAVRLAPRHEYERSSMPAGLKSLARQDPGTSASLTDVSRKKRKNKKKKRLFSFGLENFLPTPHFPLSPHGGAKSKIPMQKLPSTPSSVYGSTRSSSSAKNSLDEVEMNTYKLQLGDGHIIGSSSTDDVLDTSPLWKSDASPTIKSRSPELPRGPFLSYQRIKNEEGSYVGGSLQSLNSSQCSLDFTLGSPDTTLEEEDLEPFAHSPPMMSPVGAGCQKLDENFNEEPPVSNSSPITTSTPDPTTGVFLSPDSLTSGVKRPSSGLGDVSSPDSDASHFSYSDLPLITVSFVNDTDELTHL